MHASLYNNIIYKEKNIRACLEKALPVSSQKNKGKRLPEAWKPNEQNIKYALNAGLDEKEIRREAELFYNYWTSLSGAKANKLCWNKTWNSWIINNRKREGARKTAINGDFKDLNNVVAKNMELTKTILEKNDKPQEVSILDIRRTFNGQ